MQAPIARPDTRVVIVLIKFTGHLHAEKARKYARAAGVPSVNVEGGYHPNTLAEKIIQQADIRLRI
ncbi:MAG: hypothetical protein D6692_10815 [Planctomycetota bacterium]|nr:MAG: hypothetical protein D6692_10815 [Planctomycetota bacterium]